MHTQEAYYVFPFIWNVQNKQLYRESRWVIAYCWEGVGAGGVVGRAVEKVVVGGGQLGSDC